SVTTWAWAADAALTTHTKVTSAITGHPVFKIAPCSLSAANVLGERRGPPRRSQPSGSTPDRIRQPPPTWTQAVRWPRDQPMGTAWSPKPHLLGSLPDKFKCLAGRRPWIGELQFVRRERGDNSFLISPDHVRIRTSLNFGVEDLIHLVDRVCAIVGDGSRHHGSGFFRGRPRAISGRQLGKVSAHIHKSKVTVARID